MAMRRLPLLAERDHMITTEGDVRSGIGFRIAQARANQVIYTLKAVYYT